MNQELKRQIVVAYNQCDKDYKKFEKEVYKRTGLKKSGLNKPHIQNLIKTFIFTKPKVMNKKQIRIRTKSTGRYKQFFDGTNYQMNKTNSPIIRQYALNTTGSQNTSLMYGTPHQIFMINNYKYMWSPIIEDYINITININKIFTKKESDKYLQQFKQIQNNQFEVGKWYWNLIKNQYKFNNLPQAIKSGNEILFSNDDGYLAMNTTHPDYKEIIKNKLL